MGFVILKSRTSAYNQAIELTNTHAKKAAADVKFLIERDMSLVRTLAKGFVVYDEMEEADWLDLMKKMYRPLYAANPQFYALWDSWEMKYFKPGWDKDYGRNSFQIWKENGILLEKLEERSLTGDPELYGTFKKGAVEAIWEPYLDNSTAVTEKHLMASLCVPTLIDGEYRGMVGVDILLDQFQKIVETIKPFEEGYAFLISNGGIIAGHPTSEYINKNISEVYEEDFNNNAIGAKIKTGESFNYISRDKFGNGHYFTYEPITVAETGTPWSLCVSVPLDQINMEADKNFRISLIIGIFVILILAVLLTIIALNISNPISKLTSSIKRLANGEISKDMIQDIDSGDEIEEMGIALNRAIEGLTEKNLFATEIGAGNLNKELDLISENDILGESLIEMQTSLKKAKEDEENLKKEDQKRRWSNEGLAKFGDILRQNYNELSDLSYSIIKNLVHYLGANQGGLFVKDETLDEGEQDRFLLDAAFAFDRRKYINKEVEIGDGLVGTCAIEKQTVYITDIPQDYVEITSGLGGANPNALLIVPLKLEDDVYGIIEIASFKQLEQHEIEFVEKLGESIASTIASVKVNARTAMLLEKSQQQAEEMAAQEEEMRQNLEELQATQEEMARKRAESEAMEEALNSSVGILELDFNKRIISCNDLLLTTINLQEEDINGKFHFDFILDERINSEEYIHIWNSLKSGEKVKDKAMYSFNGKESMFNESYVPVQDENGDYSKVILVLTER